MEHFSIPTNLSEDQAETLRSVQTEYGIKINGGVFSVTPAAHEYFRLLPIVKTVTGGVEYKLHKEARTPSVEVVFVAPYEIPLDAGQKNEKTFYDRQKTGCTFWVTHPENQQEYIADGWKRQLGSIRQAYTDLGSASDEEILSELGQAIKRQRDDELRVGQLADLLNCLELPLISQVSFLRESSYSMTAVRRNRLRESGIPMRFHAHDGEYRTEFITSAGNEAYALKRAFRVTQTIWNVFMRDDFATHRKNRLIMNPSAAQAIFGIEK